MLKDIAMADLKVPAGYNTVMPYLIVDDAAALMQFLVTVFDAKLKMHHPNPDGSFGHAEVTIGEICIMFSNTMPEWGANTAGLFIYVDNADERYKLALANGAISVMPPADQDYGRSCGVKDSNGNTWWITSVK